MKERLSLYTAGVLIVGGLIGWLISTYLDNQTI